MRVERVGKGGARGRRHRRRSLATRGTRRQSRERSKTSEFGRLTVVHAVVNARAARAQPGDRVGDAVDRHELRAAPPSRARSLGTRMRAEAEARGLAHAQLESRDAPHLAAEPDLAARGGVGRKRQVEPARRERERDAEIGGRLRARARRRPRSRRRRASEIDAARRSSTASSSASAAVVDAERRCDARCRSRPARRAPGPRPGSAACPRAAARRTSPARRRGARRGTARSDSSTASRPASLIVKTPISWVEPKRFLLARSRRKAWPRSPSKMQHDVDQVLEHARARRARRPW